MVKFELTDNRIKVKAAIRAAAVAWLHEACGEIQAQTMRNTKVKTGKTKGSWQYRVDEDALEGIVGSNYENAIWEEYGTGEYALNGDGRKGGWWIPLNVGGMTEKQAKAYGFFILKGKNGQKYAFTRGKRPKRPMFRAFTSLKGKLKRLAEEKFKELGQ